MRKTDFGKDRNRNYSKVIGKKMGCTLLKNMFKKKLYNAFGALSRCQQQIQPERRQYYSTMNLPHSNKYKFQRPSMRSRENKYLKNASGTRLVDHSQLGTVVGELMKSVYENPKMGTSQVVRSQLLGHNSSENIAGETLTTEPVYPDNRMRHGFYSRGDIHYGRDGREPRNTTFTDGYGNQIKQEHPYRKLNSSQYNLGSQDHWKVKREMANKYSKTRANLYNNGLEREQIYEQDEFYRGGYRSGGEVLHSRNHMFKKKNLQYLLILNGLLKKIFDRQKQKSFTMIVEDNAMEELMVNKDNFERVKASFIELVLKRGGIKIHKNHREAQVETLYRIFHSLDQREFHEN